MNTFRALVLGACLLLLGCEAKPEIKKENMPFIQAENQIEAGRYLIKISGCNDCHTDGYMFNGGITPESEWLTGTVLGCRGPWGTTYPANLRLCVQELTEDQWVEMLHLRNTLPPMAWPSVNSMSEQDLRAIYAYIKSPVLVNN